MVHIKKERKRYLHGRVFTTLYSSPGFDEVKEAIKKAEAAMVSGEWENLHLAIEDDYGSLNIIIEGTRIENDAEVDRAEHGSHCIHEHCWNFLATLDECTQCQSNIKQRGIGKKLPKGSLKLSKDDIKDIVAGLKD